VIILSRGAAATRLFHGFCHLKGLNGFLLLFFLAKEALVPELDLSVTSVQIG
jgi:hypothetical protein